MRYCIFLFFFSFLLLSCQEEKSSEFIIHNFENKIENNLAWEYDINYKMKYFSADDTLNYNSNCRLIRHKSDTIFGGSFWMKHDSIDRYYDLKNIYVINHNQKSITRYFPHQGQDWAIKGNTISGVLNTYFLRNNNLSSYLKDTTTTTTLLDTTFHNSSVHAVEFKFKDDLPIENERKTFYFNQNNELNSISYSVKYKHEWQYEEWHFTNKKYESITDVDLKNEFEKLKRNYKLEDYKEPESDPKEMKPISNGIKAPAFKGFNFQTKDSIKLNSYKGKYVLIDFWYRQCYYCKKAIPALNDLRTKYSKNDLVILGLNPYDKSEKDKAKIDEFIDAYKMKYPTILVDYKTAKDYNIFVYPTFYIIDKKGEIVYSKIGYKENNEVEIDSLLSEWIK